MSGFQSFFLKMAKKHDFLATKLQYVGGIFFSWLTAVTICPWWPMATMDKTPLHV